MRNQPALIAEKIAAKFQRTAKLAADAGILPYKSADGCWIPSPYDGNSWWTGGFWPGGGEESWRVAGARRPLFRERPPRKSGEWR